MARDSVPGLTERLVGFLQRYPKLSLATGGVLFVFLAAGLTRVEMNFTYRSFFHGTDPLIRTFEAFEARFGSDDSIIVAVYSPSGIFDEDSVELVSELTERMWLFVSTFKWELGDIIIWDNRFLAHRAGRTESPNGHLEESIAKEEATMDYRIIIDDGQPMYLEG